MNSPLIWGTNTSLSGDKKANYLHCNRDVVANMSVNGVTIEDWGWLLGIFETKNRPQGPINSTRNESKNFLF